MKTVLRLASLGEGGFGVLLFAAPQLVSRLLFAVDVSGVGVTLGRLTGVSIFALAIACWPTGDSRSAYYGMLTWSVVAMLYLIVVRFDGTSGILLWPAVVAHSAIALLLLWTRR
jgi:hypothetical protein